MKKFVLGLTTCLVAVTLHSAMAGVSQEEADTLKTTLTPFGSIRAGTADGLVPAWTGGLVEADQGTTLVGIPPDPYAKDQVMITIDANNYAQYEDKLTPGLIAMFKLYPNFKMLVYPSHRPAAAPQWVYDNTAQNAVTAEAVPTGILNGFQNAYGGVPFPIIKADDPDAGAELVWDHMSRWQGTSSYGIDTGYVVNNGPPTLVQASKQWIFDPYYIPGGNVKTFDGYMTKFKFIIFDPADIDGSAFVQWDKASGTPDDITTSWQYLNGQGRVRQAPELKFDTPSNQTDDVSNYDEYFMFTSSPCQYDWKYDGEKEMIIPYDNNTFLNASATDSLGKHFISPELVRFEVHRVYVVTGTLKSGYRNVMAKRVFYIDEDTDTIALADEYDAKGNLYHMMMGFFEVRPSLPGTFLGASVVYNMQTGQYVIPNGPIKDGSQPNEMQFFATEKYPPSTFNPQELAAQEQF